MLDELHILAETLAKTDLHVQMTHRFYKPCRKTVTFVLNLDASGNLVDVTSYPISDASNFLRWTKDNFRSFPAFNFPPIYHICNKKEVDNGKRLQTLMKNITGSKLSSDESIKEWQSILSISVPGWEKKDDDAFRRHLDEASRELYDALDMSTQATEPIEFAVHELISRAQKIKKEIFQKQLVSLVDIKIKTAPILAADIIRNLIIGIPNSKGTIPTGQVRQVFLDLAESGKKGFPPIISKMVSTWINQKLLIREKQSVSLTGTDCILDAFGEQVSLDETNDLMPKVNLKGIGNIILRSLNKEIPCQTRYGLTGSASFRVGMTARQRMQDALRWITGPEQEGKTWKNISILMGGQKTVFCAYLDIDAKSARNISPIEIFSFDEDLVKKTEGQSIVTVAEKIISSLQGIIADTPSAKIRTFILVNLDKARNKLIYPRRLGAIHLLERARDWQQGCLNIPAIRDNEQLAYIAPVEIARLVNTIWLRGSDATKCSSASIIDGLSLFLDDEIIRKKTAQRLLRLAVTHAEPFFVKITRQRNNISFRSRDAKKTYLPSDDEYWRKTPALLGLLLWMLGRERGVYMTNYAYLLGKILSMVDVLHKEYATRDEKSKVPPRLLGNVHLSIALRTPEKAMAMLAERLPIYQAWGATAHDNGLARWALKEIGIIASALKDFDIPRGTTEADKSEMILGYLSRETSK